MEQKVDSENKIRLRLKFALWLLFAFLFVATITGTTVINLLNFQSWHASYTSREEIRRFIDMLRSTHSRMELAMLYTDEISFDHVSIQQKKEINKFVHSFLTRKKGFHNDVVLNLEYLYSEYISYARAGLHESDKSYVIVMSGLKFEKVMQKTLEILNLDDTNFFSDSAFLIDIGDFLDTYNLTIVVILTISLLLIMLIFIKKFFLPFETILLELCQLEYKNWKQLQQKINKIISKFGSHTVTEIQIFFNFLKKFTEKIRETEEKLNEAIVLDSKTNLFNFRYFENMLILEAIRSKRFNQPLSILMADVDFFKFYNDTNGHVEGDTVLIEIAKIIKQEIRETDIAARFGGEEFSIILPNTQKSDAIILAERLRKSVQEKQFKFEGDQPDGDVTVSIGVASMPDDSLNAELLIRCADLALYQAKRNGRNRVDVYDSNIMKKP